jgi:hypothetical protein
MVLRMMQKETPTVLEAEKSPPLPELRRSW